MINIFQKYSFYLCLVLALFTTSMEAQVYPGDVNDDGIVDNVDFLYVGTIFGQAGPPRDLLEQGIDFTEKVIATPWGISFVNGVDYAYADCDGNGIIDFNDLNTVIANMGLTHGIVMPEVFVGGDFGIDPMISFDTTFIFGPFPEFAIVTIPVSLGSEEFPVEDFQGLSFEVHYDPSIVWTDTEMQFNFDNSSWINSANDLHLTPPDANTTPGVLRVAATRIFPLSNSANNYGKIGSLQFIIEDDLLDYTEPAIQTMIEFQNVTVLGGNGAPTPVVPDTVTIEIIDNSILSTDPELPDNSLELFPNPFEDQLNIKSINENLESIQIFDVNGSLLQDFSKLDKKEVVLPLEELAQGIYFVRIRTKEGVRTKKISKL